MGQPKKPPEQDYAGRNFCGMRLREILRSRLDFFRQIAQALAAKSITFFRIIAHRQDCHHPRIDIAASMANQQPPVGTDLEPAFGDCHRIFDQFDLYKIAFTLQRLSQRFTRYGFGAAIHVKPLRFGRIER